MAEYIAIPFRPDPPTKLTYVLDRLVEHDNWWTDFQTGRREIAASILAGTLTPNPVSFAFEVWRKQEPVGQQPVGLVLFSDWYEGMDVKFHPVFFDGRMSNALGKRKLLLSLLAWAFASLGVERVSAEVPEYAHALVDYARRKLGFRYEAEGRTIHIRTTGSGRRNRATVARQPTLYQAACGSRKHRIVRCRGEWYDLILLSVTRAEFAAFIRATEAADGQLLPAPRSASSGPEGPSGTP